MNAEPLLKLIARLLARHRLEAVLIGNAAAAIQGSPVTTVDLDFMFRKTPANLGKLKRIADDLDAVVLRPFYPVSELFRVVRDRDGLQLDFMARIDGIRSVASLRSRAVRVRFGRFELLVASVPGTIAARKRRAGRRIARCCQFSGRLSMSRKSPSRRWRPLRRESERALVDQIRRLLALPRSKRTHFLRKRLPGGGSAL